MQKTANLLKFIGGLLALAAIAIFLTQSFWPSLDKQTHGFAAYYTAAWMLQHGQVAGVYNASQFNAAMQNSGIVGIYDIYDANAPLLIFATWPLAWWPPATARIIWLWFNFGLLLAVIFCAVRLFLPQSRQLSSLIPFLMLFYAPLQENFRLGQVYLPFLLAAFAGLIIKNPVGGAFALAIQLIFKLYYGLFGLVAGLARPKILLLAIGLTTGLAVILLPWLGLPLWFDYIRLAGGFSGRPETSVNAYQTINSLFSHLLRFDADWNPSPVADLPWLAQVLTLLLGAGLVITSAVICWPIMRTQNGKYATKRQHLPVAIAFSLAPVLAPAAEEYHFTLLLLPLLVAVAVWLEQERRSIMVLVGWLIAVALLAPPWEYKKWPLEGWAALLSYPRLYGALILWLVLVRLCLQKSKKVA